MSHNTSYIPSEFKTRMRDEKILPHIERKLDYALKTETCWSNTSLAAYLMSTIILALGGIFAFASSTYPKLPMGFIAGILIFIGTAFKDFVHFATNLDHIKVTEVNDIMKNIGINFQLDDESGLLQNNNSESKNNTLSSIKESINTTQTLQTLNIPQREQNISDLQSDV